MIIGGTLILFAFILYCFYTPPKPPKGSLTYYKRKWSEISTY
jgi:hypothetical protein